MRIASFALFGIAAGSAFVGVLDVDELVMARREDEQKERAADDATRGGPQKEALLPRGMPAWRAAAGTPPPAGWASSVAVGSTARRQDSRGGGRAAKGASPAAGYSATQSPRSREAFPRRPTPSALMASSPAEQAQGSMRFRRRSL